jgi:nicotinamidase-related amidase
MGYAPLTTAILLVAPYNDFLSEGGKLWPRIKVVAEDVGLLEHLREVVLAARAQGLKIFFVPHNRWEPGDYVSFDFPSPYQLGTAKAEVFAKDSWGGTFHDDFQPQPGVCCAKTRSWRLTWRIAFTRRLCGTQRSGRPELACAQSGR